MKSERKALLALVGAIAAAGGIGYWNGALDPVSKQPELKHCAVRVRMLPMPGELE